MNINFRNVNFNIRNLYSAKSVTIPCYSNLAPLPKDTVSFSGGAKLISADMAYAPQERTCRQVSQNAEPAKFYLEKIFEKYFDPITNTDVSANPNEFPISASSIRKKSSTSIREKVVSKFAKNVRNESKKFTNQVLDSLLNNFNLKNGSTKEQVLADIQSVLDENGTVDRMSPYKNAELLFYLIINELEQQERFDFASVSPEQKSSIFYRIVEDLEENANKVEFCDEDGYYYDPETVTGIKQYANDIIGGRLVLRQTSPEHIKPVLEALKQASDDGYLKITSIENNIPAPDKLPEGKSLSDYEYATQKQLKKLAADTGSELISNKSKSGYLSLHINIAFDNDVFKKHNGTYAGYSGEIQIIGEDVLALKEVEDLCYKLKDDKNAIHVAYRPFKEYFQSYYNDKSKDAFDEYTYASYLYQRALKVSKPYASFPSIKELNFDGKVPPELDFNLLKSKKNECDLEYLKIMKKEEEERKARLSVSERLTDERRKGVIAQMRQLINFRIK